jgi:hypothetical protein
MPGFLEKLDRGAEQQGRSQSNALVRHADAERDAYMRRRYPRTRTRSTGSTEAPEAYRGGTEAGRNVEVRRPVADGARVKLLSPVGD